MKWLAVVIVAVLAHRASANECNEFLPQVVAPDVPLGCPITVYSHPDNGVAMDVTDYHLGQTSVLPATVVETSDVVGVTFDNIDDQCFDHYSTQSIPYRVFTISNFDAAVGDQVEFDGVTVWITDAAACPAVVAPVYYCTSPVMPCGSPMPHDPEPNHDLTCNAGGTTGFGAIALMLGLVLRRRR